MMELEFLYQLQTLHNPILDKIMVFFSTIGNAGTVWVLLSVFFLFFKNYRKIGVSMLLALLLGLITANICLKNLIARERPCWIDTSVTLLIPNPKDFSFPSGHTVASFAAATTLYLYHKKWGRIAIGVACIIAISRLYLFVHFPTDVLAGMLLGIFMAILSVKLIKLKWRESL